MSEIKCSFEIPKKDLLAIALFQSRDESRYVLCGVRFKVSHDRVMCTATDGRRIAILIAEAECVTVKEPVGFTVNYNAFIRLLSGNARIKVEYDGKHVWFADAEHKIQREAIEGSYPNWTLVIPDSNFKPVDICFSSNLFESFIEAQKLLSSGSGAIHLRTSAVDGLNTDEPDHLPISIFIGGCTRFYGVLMPMRHDGKIAQPDWLKAMLEPDGWKPMHSAPKDGTWIMVKAKTGFVCRAHYGSENQCWFVEEHDLGLLKIDPPIAWKHEAKTEPANA